MAFDDSFVVIHNDNELSSWEFIGQSEEEVDNCWFSEKFDQLEISEDKDEDPSVMESSPSDISTVPVSPPPYGPPSPPLRQILYALPQGCPQRIRRIPRRDGKSNTVPQPYPWATTNRATVHTLNYLESQQIVKIIGEVQCKCCGEKNEIDFDLRENFVKVVNYILQNIGTLNGRAPSIWTNPVLPTCRACGRENGLKPIISEKKRAINWLFLFLGQMLGCCPLEQIKYFCKHSKCHRTGAKDRVLYNAYYAMCKQLYPPSPFDC